MASATVFSLGELCNLKIRTKWLFNALGKSIEINVVFFFYFTLFSYTYSFNFFTDILCSYTILQYRI